MITCVSLTRSPFGARARSTFVKSLDRASPFFHVRSPHGARTLPTSMLDRGDAHIAVVVSRRSCRARVYEVHLSAFRFTRGSRLCFTPLAFTLSSSCFGVHARPRLATRNVVFAAGCPRRLASLDAKRRACLLGGCARVHLATFACALTFGSRRRSFTLDSRAHARLTTCMTASTSRERPSTFASVLTSRFLLAKEALALTSVMAVVDRLATIPRDHFRRLTVHGRAISCHVSGVREDVPFDPSPRMTTMTVLSATHRRMTKRDPLSIESRSDELTKTLRPLCSRSRSSSLFQSPRSLITAGILVLRNQPPHHSSDPLAKTVATCHVFDPLAKIFVMTTTS
jgi:hypothetical protein